MTTSRGIRICLTIVGVSTVAALVLFMSTSARCHQVGQMPQTLLLNVIPELKKYRFQLGWWRLGPLPDEPCLLAVGPDGQILYMPNNFDMLVRREEISISSPESSLDLATTYVTLTSPYRVVVLSDLDMIPGIDRDPVPQHHSGVTISAPVVEKSSEGYYIVHLYTWKELGGVLEEWTLTISADGTVKPEVRTLQKWVGAALGTG